MARTASVHLESDRFEALVLEGTPKRWRIVGADAGEIAAPAEGESPSEPGAAAIGVALKKLKAPRDPVVLAAPSAGSVLRNLTLPFTGEDEIKKVLKFECESHLHQYGIDDVVICHVAVAEKKGSTDMIVAAAPKKLLRQYIDSLERAGFDPVIVDLDVLSLFNALVATASVPETGAVLVLHVGPRVTHALMITDRRLHFVRSIRCGVAANPAVAAVAAPDATAEGAAAPETAPADAGAPAEPAPAHAAGDEDFVITFEEAESSEGRALTLDYDVLDERREEFLRRLQRETLRTIAAEASVGISEVLVCGEGVGLPGLLERVSAAANVPARELDVLANVPGAPTAPEMRRRLPIALGAALKPLGVDVTKTDFRQEDLRFAKKLDALKVPIATLVGAAAFVILLQCIYVFRETAKKQQYLENLADVAAARVRGAMPKENLSSLAELPPMKRMENYLVKLNGEAQKYRDMLGGGGAAFSKPQSSFDAMQRIFQVFETYKEEFGLFVLDDFIATSADRPAQVDVRMTLTFIGDDASTSARVDKFRARLKEQRWCVDAPPPAIKPVGGIGKVAEGMTVKVDLSKEQSS